MISDRQRIELAFPGFLMAHMVAYAAAGDEAERKATVRMLQVAAAEAMGDVSSAECVKLMRRVNRLYTDAVPPWMREKVEIGRIGLLAFLFVRELLEQNVLVMHAGSAMSNAMDRVIPTLQVAANDAASMGFAEQALPESVGRVRRAGYYEGLAERVRLAS